MRWTTLWLPFPLGWSGLCSLPDTASQGTGSGWLWGMLLSTALGNSRWFYQESGSRLSELRLFDHSLNSTYIALIPKLAQSVDVTNFCPISLCNVLYKLIAKVLANRLKRVLPRIISPQQSAFVPGRLIFDNVLVAYEALHTMQTRLRGKKGFMAIKLDMSKAYDRVEWGFLEAMMRRMGFADWWIDLIMKCVSSVSYSVLVNGVPQDRFQPTRGIWQGDPLSPYLFLLCAEGLSSLLQRAKMDERINGVPVATGGTMIIHLFFLRMTTFFFCRGKL